MSSELFTVEIGPHRVAGGWFIDRGPSAVEPATPPQEVAGAQLRHVFTDDVRQIPSVRDAILKQIRAAEDKVLFCSFILSDDVIVEELCSAAERLHGGVYVLTALGKHLQSDRGETDEAPRDEERRRRHNEQLRSMVRAGVWVRSVDDCHAKFCVVDDARAVLTSCNATREAYVTNPENGVVIESSALAKPLAALFARAWLGMATLEQVPGEEVNLKDKLTRVQLPAWQAPSETEGTRLIATVQTEDHSLKEETIALLNSAKEELVIASYSAVSLSSHPVGHALREALLRGVRVVLVLRPKNHHDDQRATCEWLFDGVRPGQATVRGHRLTHAKAIVADRKKALLWTGNLDGKHGYDDGIEVGLVTADPGMVAAVRAHVLEVVARSSTELVVRPTQSELAAHSAARTEGDWTVTLARSVKPPPELVARLQSNVIEIYGDGADASLQVGPGFALIGRVDRTTRSIAVSSIQRRAAPRQKPTAVVAGCSLRFVRDEGDKT